MATDKLLQLLNTDFYKFIIEYCRINNVFLFAKVFITHSFVEKSKQHASFVSQFNKQT